MSTFVRRVSSTNVRRPTSADAGAIADVHVRSWQIAYRGLVPDEVLDNLSIAHRKSTWQTLLARNAKGAFTLVARSRDDDAGERTCEVAALYVDPDHWRAGIGRKLLVTALREVAAAGAEHVTLWVFAENHPALAFYRRFGFVADGAEKWHEASGQKEIRLRAPINPA